MEVEVDEVKEVASDDDVKGKQLQILQFTILI
jgi:hypothetical protein